MVDLTDRLAPTAAWPGTCRRASGPSCASAAPAPAPTRGRRPRRAWGWSATSSTRPRSTRISTRSSARCCARSARADRRGQAGWTMLHIDSWEMGAQNWTAAFREEFRRRRGYDPLRYLPAIDGPRGGQPGSLRAVPLGPAADGAGAGHREPRRASEGPGPPPRLRAFHRALRHEPVRRHEPGRGGRRADVRVLARTASTPPTASSRRPRSRHTCGRPIVAAESFTSGDDGALAGVSRRR